jgi:hypothetical protein
MRRLASRQTLRPLNMPHAVDVSVDAQGTPSMVRRVGAEAHAVVAVQDRWRIDDEWWREHAISRAYYLLLLDDGSLLSVYHDLLANAWFQQRS